MDISVVTVTWNSAGHITRQLSSVRRAFGNRPYQHIVIDNNSTDSTTQNIVRDFPEVTLIKNTTNIGFAAANNQAKFVATGKYLLFVNPDMEVTQESIQAMERFLDNNDRTVIVGCRLKNEHGEDRLALGPTRFPTFTQLLVLIFKLPVFFPKLLRRWSYVLAAENLPFQVDAVRGSCLMMRASFAEQLGFAFDPRYFIWFEDVDICREAKRLGRTVYFLPGVSSVDFMGQSFKQVHHVQRQRQFLKSAIIYFKKWHPAYQAVVLQILSPLSILVVWLYAYSRICNERYVFFLTN
jgi:GT2 family glycosyltransferase